MSRTRTSSDPESGFRRWISDTLKLIPPEARLPGFLLALIILALLALRPTLDGWQVTVLCLIFSLSSVFSVWVHRPERPTAVGGPTTQPPYIVLDGEILRSLAAHPILFPLILNPAAIVLRTEIQRQVKRVKKRPVKNSDADVFKELQMMTGVQDRVILDALITWAK